MASGMTRPQDGFTLVEMMLALAILVFGVSALAGSLLTGVSMRRGSEMRFRADALVNQAVHRIQEGEFPRYSDPGEPLQSFTVTDPPGYSGMEYTVDYVTDLERPGLVLAKIRISWRDQGERMGETFERILVRRVSFSQRISDLTKNR